MTMTTVLRGAYTHQITDSRGGRSWTLCDVQTTEDRLERADSSEIDCPVCLGERSKLARPLLRQ